MPSGIDRIAQIAEDGYTTKPYLYWIKLHYRVLGGEGRDKVVGTLMSREDSRDAPLRRGKRS